MTDTNVVTLIEKLREVQALPARSLRANARIINEWAGEAADFLSDNARALYTTALSTPSTPGEESDRCNCGLPKHGPGDHHPFCLFKPDAMGEANLTAQIVRDVVAFQALPAAEQDALRHELVMIGCNPGVVFAAPSTQLESAAPAFHETGVSLNVEARARTAIAFYEAVKGYSYPDGQEVRARIHATGWDVYDPDKWPCDRPSEGEGLWEALTPSGGTKAAYMGEFSFNVPDYDDEGEEWPRKVYVPWDTIKEIMAAILKRGER